MTTDLKQLVSATPDKNGWWYFHERGMRGEQLVLVIDGHVADDQQFEAATGRVPGDGENYWDGTSVSDMTDGTYTSGKWVWCMPANAANSGGTK